MVSEDPKPLDSPGKGTTIKNPEQDTIMEDSQSSNTQDTTAAMHAALDEIKIEPTNKAPDIVKHMRRFILENMISRPLTPKGSKKVLKEARRCKRLKERRAKREEKRAMGNRLDCFNTLTLGSTQDESSSSSTSKDSAYLADSEDNMAN